MGGDAALAQAGCKWIAYRSAELFGDRRLLDLLSQVEAFVQGHSKQPVQRIIDLLDDVSTAIESVPEDRKS